ncbi:hypothetical protein AB0J48_20480 [Nocardia salmonicida]|uniref:phage gene 29 protein family protein n=1 Tax=Nocardia salmonicida TaxID=53431 RepID=UPI00341F5A5D
MEYPPAPPGFEHLDMSDPKQALAWALGAMPSHQPNGQPVPIPPKVVPSWSEFLTALGLVYDPSRQTLFPIVDEARAPLGWLAPVTWVTAEEYEQHEAKRAGKVADMEATLQKLNPGLAQQIADMTDPEKRDAMASQAVVISDILTHIQQQHGGGQDG